MVVIAGHVARVSVFDFSGEVTERIPDTQTAAILLRGAFELIGGGGGAPPEFVGKFPGRNLVWFALVLLGLGCCDQRTHR